MDEMEPTDAQKNEWIIEALGIAGFTENSDYLGVYTQERGMKKIVKDLNICGKSYFLVDKKKVEDDDEHATLAKVDRIIAEAETGQMPKRNDPEEVVNVTRTMNQAEPVPTEAVNVPAVREPSMALTPSDIVRPAVSAIQALEAWREFQELQKAILEPSDIQRIQGKDFKVKSAWRKFATFFNLNDKIVEETQTLHADGQGWTWKIKVICTAPNGRFTEGVGMCSTSERNFTHVEHDTYSTAHTRAKNRAISDMVAAGEVSAEEVST